MVCFYFDTSDIAELISCGVYPKFFLRQDELRERVAILSSFSIPIAIGTNHPVQRHSKGMKGRFLSGM
jgi:hypothetical protein